MSDLASFMASVKTLKDMGKAMLDVRDAAKAQDLIFKYNEILADLQSRVINTQTAQIEMTETIAQQKKQIEEYKEQLNVKGQYTLKQVVPGFFAYVDDSSSMDLANTQKLCANCFDNGIKSTLKEGKTKKYNPLLTCNTCKDEKAFYHYLDNSASDQ